MEKYTIQVLGQNDTSIGATFLVDSDLLLTCAHVVRAAGSAPKQSISLRTPRGTELSATVEAWRDENAEDITTLRLTAPLDEMKALPLGTSSGSKGHTFSTYGFPQPDQALSGSGTITGYATLNGIQYLQLESSQVTPGFSGAPVFDNVTKRVVGLVVAIAPPDEYQRQGTTAFAIPAETLRNVCGLALSDLCPYRSLDAFTEADADLFFGRERVVAKLLETLKRNPRFLAVLGPSGSGKSSVVQAGLIPALSSGQLSGSEKWGILNIRPGTQPFDQLASAGMKDSTNLIQATSDWLAAHPQNERLLILIDQFEELLVSTPSDTRADFVAALADLLGSSLPVSVLLTLRDDFYNRFTQGAGALVDWIESALVNIPPMLEESELREIIARPARDLGLIFAPGLVDAILADARTADPSKTHLRSTVLPLLEFTLTQLWERRVEGELTHEAYRAMGGVTGGLSQWADRAYYALDDGQRTLARRVFSELVTLGDEMQGIADTRRVRNIAELTEKDSEPSKTVLDALVTARLLVARYDESSGQDTVEIIHETLLREWALLESWLRDDRQFLIWRESLRTSQQAWRESSQDAGALLRGIPLAESEEWLEKRESDLGEVESDYITKSVALRVRSERNRRWVIVGLALVAMLMAGLAVWGSSSAMEARNQAATAQAERDRAEEQSNTALARQLAAQAQSLFATGNSKQMTAVLLAVQSMQIQATGEAAQILGNNTLVTPVASMTYESSVFSVAFSPDGQYVVSSGCDNRDEDNRCIEGSARVWDAASGREVVRITQGDYIFSVAFSPDGKYLVAGSADGTARVIEISTQQEISRISHENGVSTVAFSPDGNRIASASCKEYKNGFCAFGIVRVWDTHTGQESIHMLHEGGSISSVTFSPNGQYIVSAGSYPDSTVRVWDVFSGKLIAHVDHDDGGGGVTSVAFSPDGHYIVSAAVWADTIRVWEASSGREFVRMEHDNVHSVTFSPDGKYVASGSSDRTARVWDSQTGQEVARMLHDSLVSEVMFSPNGLFVATASYDGTVRIWKPTTGKEVARLNHQSLVNSIDFNSDGTSIVSAGCEIRNDTGYCGFGTATVWNVESELNFRGQSALEVARMVQSYLVGFITFSPDGRYFLSGSNEKALRVWDAYTWSEITRLPHDSSVSSATFSLNRNYVITLGKDGLRVWDVSDWHEIYHIAFDDSITSINFSPDGRYIVLNGSDNTVRILNVADRKEITRLHHDNHATSVAFSHDGQYVATGSEDQTIRIWRVSDGKETVRISQKDSIISVDFDSDGRYVVSRGCTQKDDLGNCEASMVRVWNTRNGEEIAYLPINGFASFTKLSPNGEVAASFSNEDKTMVLWNIESGEELARMLIENIAQSVEFSSDGRFVALVGCGQQKDVIFSEVCSSGIVLVWDALSGQEIIRIDQASTVLNVVFSPDGHYIVTGDYDGLIQVRLYRPQDIIDHTCARVTRNLTRAEWNQYIGNVLPYQAVCSNLPIEIDPITPAP